MSEMIASLLSATATHVFVDYKIYMIWTQGNLGIRWIFLRELEISRLVAQCMASGSDSDIESVGVR